MSYLSVGGQYVSQRAKPTNQTEPSSILSIEIRNMSC